MDYNKSKFSLDDQFSIYFLGKLFLLFYFYICLQYLNVANIERKSNDLELILFLQRRFYRAHYTKFAN